MVIRNLTEWEVSRKYGPTLFWFRRMRRDGGGPPFIKLPGVSGRIFYPENLADEYFASRIITSTRDQGNSAA